MGKTKPLTEKGSLNKHFSNILGSIRPSTEEYRNSLNTFFLHKEILEFTNRYKWVNLPDNLNSLLIETMLYQRGQVCFFKLADTYYILPFVYTGKINQYGLFSELIPISFSGVIGDNDINHFAPTHKAIYFKENINDYKNELNKAIVLRTSASLWLNQAIPPCVITNQLRQKLTENLILIRNNLILSQPIKYVLTKNEDTAKSIRSQVDNMLNDILNGNIVQVFTDILETNDFVSDTPNINTSQLWQSYVSLDSLRLEYLGILNNGAFEKRERFLSDEVDAKQRASKINLYEGLERRKEFCKLVNDCFGLNIDCVVNEYVDDGKSPYKDILKENENDKV